MASLTNMQLVDIAPHHSGHGTLPLRCSKCICLTQSPGPDGHPPPLRHDAPPNDAQEARPPQDPPAALPCPRRQPAHQRQRHLPGFLPGAQGLHGAGIPGGQVPGRPGVEGQAETESHERPSSHGGHDGHDEGKHGHDDPAESNYGVDQRLLFGLRYQ
jgi:hypothetical protein